MNLMPPPGSPFLLRAAAEGVLVLHIGAGCVGIVSGAAALLARKGARLHRWIGNVFFVSMLIMSGIGGIVSPFLPQRANVVPAIFTFYLVATAWAAVRRRDGGVGRFEIGAFLVALGAVATGVAFGLQAANSPTGLLDAEAPSNYFAFATFPALAAIADLSVILRGGVSGGQRIARHLWRMCMALFIAAGSLFLGQPKVFPPALRGSPIMLAPEIAILGLMVFWLARVWLTKRFRNRSIPAPAARVDHALGQPA